MPLLDTKETDEQQQKKFHTRELCFPKLAPDFKGYISISTQLLATWVFQFLASPEIWENSATDSGHVGLANMSAEKHKPWFNSEIPHLGLLGNWNGRLLYLLYGSWSGDKRKHGALQEPSKTLEEKERSFSFIWSDYGVVALNADDYQTLFSWPSRYWFQSKRTYH